MIENESFESTEAFSSPTLMNKWIECRIENESFESAEAFTSPILMNAWIECKRQTQGFHLKDEVSPFLSEDQVFFMMN